MNNNYLILKLHPTQVAYYLNKGNYGIVKITTNLEYSADMLDERFLSIKADNVQVDKIAFEKPYLRLLGDKYSRKLAESIIHTQRTFGVILYLTYKIFPGVPRYHISSKEAREKIYGHDIDKDIMLSECRVLLEDTDDLSPLSLLCLHDCLVIQRYLELMDEK